MKRVVREGFGGTGPGAITPDGCAVELYARLPAQGEPDVIASAVPAGARLLELGCGAGRVTRPLVERGFAVTAVDESPEMLERVERAAGAATVCSPIEVLDLGERFDAVLLCSFLVHSGDPGVARGMLEACRRHVSGGGCVILQREPYDAHTSVPRTRDVAGGTVRIASSTPVAPGVRRVFAEYEFPDARWTQTFLSRPLTREAFEAALAGAGLAVDAYLTDDHVWVRAVPAG
ncbi:class I SAM-dependent methyltransferase [Nocardiopsis potens]|uniref:class I SAM-dependent methyltransferase n=1 Tax=Nocardiopsis potens TaxID=1246458 RepID=UPI00047842B5|nr:class I SAM-dependent methyltransferase [Nocardiopsis potens]